MHVWSTLAITKICECMWKICLRHLIAEISGKIILNNKCFINACAYYEISVITEQLTKSLLSRIRSNCSVISIEAVLKRWIRVFFAFQNVITVGFCVSRRSFCTALLEFVLHVHGGCTSTSEMLILEAGDGLRLSWTNSWPNRDAIHSRERNRSVSVALLMPEDASFANSFLRSVTTDFGRNFMFFFCVSEMSLIFAWREWCGNTHVFSSSF